MEVLDKRIRQRRANFQFYYKELSHYDGVKFLTENGQYYSNYWLTTLIIDNHKATSDDVWNALDRENIDARPLWKPMHLQPVFKSFPAYLNGISEHLFNKGLCLPSGSNLTQEDKHRIIQVLHKILQG